MSDSPQLYGLEILDVRVGEWCPTPDGSGSPQAVALALTVAWQQQLPIELVLRLKSPMAVDKLVDSLRTAKTGVWPESPPAAHAACDEGEQRLAMQDQIERGHLRERLNRFRDEYNAATGRSLNYRQASQLLLDWALGHVNLVESILEVDGMEDA